MDKDSDPGARPTTAAGGGLLPHNMLVRTMLQEAGCDVGTKRIVWVKVNPDYEILFRLMDGLQPDSGRRYWIREYSAEENIGIIGEEFGQMETEVKIALAMSHNFLNNGRGVRTMKGNRLIIEIAQRELSDLGLERQIKCSIQGKFNRYLAHLDRYLHDYGSRLVCLAL